MTRRMILPSALCVVFIASVSGRTIQLRAQERIPGTINSISGLRLMVVGNSQPTLRIVLPGSAESDRTIEVIFPEHVTARRQGREDSEQLYLFRPGSRGERPKWRQVGQSLEYEMDLAGAVELLARATLEDDGVRFHYEYPTGPTSRTTWCMPSPILG